MSLEAMQWAMTKAPIKRNAAQCRNRLVLVALADRYNDDTRVCWPSISTIADGIGVSVPTVHKAIKELEGAGLIRRADPHWVAHLRPDRRPTVWTLNLEMVKDEKPSEPDNHIAHALDRGEDIFIPSDSRGKDVLTQRGKDVFNARGKDVLIDGVKTSLHKPKENPNLEPKHEPKDPYAHSPSGRAEAELVSEFDDWYAGYPRKTGKGAARKAFIRARKAGVPLDVLKAGLERSVRSWAAEGRAKDKIPYPATWLNAESWDDEEITAQDTSRGRSTAPARPPQPTYRDLLFGPSTGELDTIEGEMVPQAQLPTGGAPW